MDFDAEFVMGKIIEKTKRNALVIKDNFPYNEIGGKYQYTGLDSGRGCCGRVMIFAEMRA